MRRWRYEDAERPWEADEVLKKHVTRGLWPVTRGGKSRALDLGMGYGRNALWLAERGYEVEGWEVEGRYVHEARREWLQRCQAQRQQTDKARPRPGPPPAPPEPRKRIVAPKGATHKAVEEGFERRGRLRVRRGDFGGLEWAKRGQQYDVIVISQALHQLKRSAALRVLRQAKKALRPPLRPRRLRGSGGQGGGRLFLLVKLTRDKHVRRVAASEEWQRVPGEKNTWRRSAPRGRREFHAGRPRRRWRLLSALTPGEIREALRGLRLVHYREVVLRSDWHEAETVTHTVAEVVGVRARLVTRDS